MRYVFRYVETHLPNYGCYGEYEFNDGTKFRPVFGQIWNDDDDNERVYGGFGLMGRW